MKLLEINLDEADWMVKQPQFKEGWAVAHQVKLKCDTWEGPAFILFALANGAFPWGCESPEEVLKICESSGPKPYSTDEYFFVKIQSAITSEPQ